MVSPKCRVSALATALPKLSGPIPLVSPDLSSNFSTQVSLLADDPLYETKAAFLRSAERRDTEAFPLYADR